MTEDYLRIKPLGLKMNPTHLVLMGFVFLMTRRAGVHLSASAYMQLLRATVNSLDLPKTILLPDLPHP